MTLRSALLYFLAGVMASCSDNSSGAAPQEDEAFEGLSPYQAHLIPDNLPFRAQKKLAALFRNDPELLTLDLGGCRLGAAGGTAIAEALRHNTALTHLNLVASKLGQFGGVEIANALSANTTLTRLTLDGNDLGQEGGVAIAEALEVNIALTELELGCNQLGDRGGVAIAGMLTLNSTLRRLTMWDNSVTERGGRSLAGSLVLNATLEMLDLGLNGLNEKAGTAFADALRANATLKKINLEGNPLGDEGRAALAESLGGSAGIEVLLSLPPSGPQPAALFRLSESMWHAARAVALGAASAANLTVLWGAAGALYFPDWLRSASPVRSVINVAFSPIRFAKESLHRYLSRMGDRTVDGILKSVEGCPSYFAPGERQDRIVDLWEELAVERERRRMAINMRNKVRARASKSTVITVQEDDENGSSQE